MMTSSRYSKCPYSKYQEFLSLRVTHSCRILKLQILKTKFPANCNNPPKDDFKKVPKFHTKKPSLIRVINKNIFQKYPISSPYIKKM